MKSLSLPLCTSLLLFSASSFAQAPTAVPDLAPPPPPPAGAAPAPAPAPVPAPAAATAPAVAPVYAPPPPVVPAAPVVAPTVSPIELTTLRLMKEKGVISAAEYESALKDLTETMGEKRASETTSVVMGKWATQIYGFVEADHIWDSTQSFNDLAGNAAVARHGTYAGENSRAQFGIRNSRFGVRMKAPEFAGIRASGMFEMDFLGNGGIGIGAVPAYQSEAANYSSALFRVRHLNVKIETPIVDIMAGQYWALFGWLPVYTPATVEIQGVPGEIFARTAQFRVSKTVKTDSVLFEAAVAALRPPQRNSGTPEGQAGLRLGFPGWSGIQTLGSTGTSIQPISIAVSGDVRQVRLPNYFSAPPNTNSNSTDRMGTAVAVDAFLPIAPAKDRKDFSLSLNGEFASGYGTADLYTGLTGGAPTPAPAAPATGSAPVQDIDSGIAMYDRNGGLHLVQWTSYLLGGQIYLPGGKVFLTGNYSHMESANLKNNFNPNPKAFRVAEDWVDVNLFTDITPAVRFGLEWAHFIDTYGDGQHGINERAQFSAFYIF